jgi:hypothetical protein
MKSLTSITALACLTIASPSVATSLSFTGTFANTNAPGATGGRCAVLTVSIRNTPPFSAIGSSNFGSFTANQSHCLDGPPPVAIGSADRPYYDGVFAYNFASGDTLTGTYTGLLSNAGAFGIVDNVQNFLVTGGTGIFSNATGSFLGTGQLRFDQGPPSSTLMISRGTLNVSAVPEPATWGMMMLGFGAIGAMARSRRRLGQSEPLLGRIREGASSAT